MGCDGGTIPKRDELVKTKKKKEQKDRSSELAFRWQHCAITQQPLVQPIVACQLGRLYNKESILEKLLDKSAESAPEHINKLSDVTTLNLTPNPAFELNGSVAEKGDAYIDVMKSKYICPVSGLEMNGRYRFLFLLTCGCVMGERGLTMTGTNGGDEQLDCPRCLKKFNRSTDIIILNPNDDEIEKMKENMARRQQLARDLKKNKKRSAAAATVTSSAGQEAEEKSTAIKTEVPSTSNTSTTSNASRQSNGQSQVGQKSNKIVKPIPTAAPALKKFKSDYSVASDPNVSDTYKSLFTTSDKAKEQGKAHWVTYNPFYN